MRIFSLSQTHSQSLSLYCCRDFLARTHCGRVKLLELFRDRSPLVALIQHVEKIQNVRFNGQQRAQCRMSETTAAP